MVPTSSVTPLYNSPGYTSGNVGGEIPSYHPRLRSQSCETGASRSYRSPMKAHPNPNMSSPGNFAVNREEPPMQVHQNGLRSHGNSPIIDSDPHMGEIQHRGSFALSQLLPDTPLIKMNSQPQSFSPTSSMRSGKSQGESRKIFDGASPEMMFKSLDTSSTASDRQRKSSSAVSSRDNMTQHRLSPALQQAYQRHLEATGQAGMSDISLHSRSQKTTSQKSSLRSSKNYDSDSLSDSARSTPKFRNSREQPLIDLASSANISSDSLGSHSHKYKPATMETQLVPAESGNLLHTPGQEMLPLGCRSRSSTPKVSSIAAYVKEPDDLMGSYGSAGFPQRKSSPASSCNSRPRSRHSRSRTSTPNIADQSSGTGPKKFVDSFSPDGMPTSHKSRSRTLTPHNAGTDFSFGVRRDAGTPTSRKPRSRNSTPKVTDTSTSDTDESRIVKRDSHGSFVPPRKVLSQENLNFRRQPIRSVDSDSLRSPSPNHSIGFRATDSSDAEVDRISHPTYLKEFDPISSLNAREHGAKTFQDPKRSQKSTPNKNIDSSSSNTSPTITPSSHSIVSNAGFELNPQLETPSIVPNVEFVRNEKPRKARQTTRQNDTSTHPSMSGAGIEMNNQHDTHYIVPNIAYEINKKPHKMRQGRSHNPMHDVSAHSSMSSAGSEFNKKFPDNVKHPKRSPNKEHSLNNPSAQLSVSYTGLQMHTASQNSSNNSSSQHASSSTISDHASMSDNGSRKTKGPRPIKPQRNPSTKHVHDTDSSKRTPSTNSSRRSTPKMEKEMSENSSDEERKTRKMGKAIFIHRCAGIVELELIDLLCAYFQSVQNNLNATHLPRIEYEIGSFS